ncbi:hypothetical protein V3C99_000035, partial [Haemonchus contortus]
SAKRGAKMRQWRFKMPSTGQIYADRSRRHSTSMASTTPALEDA